MGDITELIVPQVSSVENVPNPDTGRVDLIVHDPAQLGVIYSNALLRTPEFKIASGEVAESYFVYEGLRPYVFGDQMRESLSAIANSGRACHVIIGKIDKENPFVHFLEQLKKPTVRPYMRVDKRPHLNYMVIDDKMALVESLQTGDEGHISIFSERDFIKTLKYNATLLTGFPNVFPLEAGIYMRFPVSSMLNYADAEEYKLAKSEPFRWIDRAIEMELHEDTFMKFNSDPARMREFLRNAERAKRDFRERTEKSIKKGVLVTIGEDVN